MFVVPLKFMCSTQCDTPVRPGRSSFDPTLYQHHTDASGAVCSSWMSTFNPLPRVVERISSFHHKIVGYMPEWKDTVNLPPTDFPMKANLATWDRPYLTMNFAYEAAIARALGRFVEQGLVYKGKKPVHWCIHCRTALAEAEVEYADHTSPSIYVEFPLSPDDAGELGRRVPPLAGKDVSV